LCNFLRIAAPSREFWTTKSQTTCSPFVWGGHSVPSAKRALKKEKKDKFQGILITTSSIYYCSIEQSIRILTIELTNATCSTHSQIVTASSRKFIVL
jgi:hypothetical protein